MQACGLEQVCMRRAMQGPSCQIANNLLSFLAPHCQLTSCGSVKLAENLNADAASPGIEQSFEQLNRFSVFASGSTIVGIHKNIRIPQFSAHEALLWTIGFCLGFHDQERFRFDSRTVASRLLLFCLDP